MSWANHPLEVARTAERRRWVRFLLPSTIRRYEHQLDCLREHVEELQKRTEQDARDKIQRERQPTQWELVAWMALASEGYDPESVTDDLNSAFSERRIVGRPEETP